MSCQSVCDAAFDSAKIPVDARLSKELAVCLVVSSPGRLFMSTECISPFVVFLCTKICQCMLLTRPHSPPCGSPHHCRSSCPACKRMPSSWLSALTWTRTVPFWPPPQAPDMPTPHLSAGLAPPCGQARTSRRQQKIRSALREKLDFTDRLLVTWLLKLLPWTSQIMLFGFCAASVTNQTRQPRAADRHAYSFMRFSS